MIPKLHDAGAGFGDATTPAIEVPPTAKSANTYMPQLDGLRALSILFLFTDHWIPGPYRFHISFIGVYTFYVLSGFLVTGILLRSRETISPTAGLRKFYARRALRIFPLFYTALALFALMQVHNVRSTLAWDATFTTNILTFLRGNWPGDVSHLWSLCLQEQFYWMWPFVILLAPRKYLLPTMVACLVVAPLSRLGLILLEAPSPSVKTFPLCSLDFLGLGALLAYRKFTHGTKAAATHLIPGWLALVGFLAYLATHIFLKYLGGDLNGHHRLLDEMGRPFLTMIFLGWFVSAAGLGFSGPVGTLLLHPITAYIGRISYGLYLLHGFMPSFLDRILTRFGQPDFIDNLSIPAFFVVNSAATLALAALSFHFFETPILRLKNVLFPPTPKPATPARASLAPEF